MGKDLRPEVLEQGKYHEVMNRAKQTVEIAKRDKYLLDIALDQLSMRRAWMMKAQKEKRKDFAKAKNHLDQAVEGLRESGNQDDLPRGLLARVEYYRLQKEFSKAWEDLLEAEEIAQLGSMKLFLADYHLEAGKLCQAQGKQQDARKHFTTAKEMMEEMGYKRKLKEVEEALGGREFKL